MVYMVIILVVSIRWILPRVTKEFLGVSYGIAVFLLIADSLFKRLHYLSLTAFELIAFILAFTWILLLLQHIERLTHEMEQVFEVRIVDNASQDQPNDGEQ